MDSMERRRRWMDDQKLSIPMEVGHRGATVADVSRRHAVSRSQLYALRRELKRHGAPRPSDQAEGRPVFVPVAPPLLPAPAAATVEAALSSASSAPDENDAGAPFAHVAAAARGMEVCCTDHASVASYRNRWPSNGSRRGILEVPPLVEPR